MPHESGSDTPEPAGLAPAGDGPRTRRRPRRKALRITAWAAFGVLVLGGSGVACLWAHLNGNLQGVDIDAALGKDRPSEAHNGAMNILLLGSDSRAGTHGEYGHGVSGARSDTTMVLHVDKAHDKAGIVSIPRDTMVNRPACPTPKGGTAPAAQQAMFNESYQVGGPGCTVKTVEKMSGVRMDHYLEVDFTGFKKIIDELGGVDVTTQRAVKDANSKLDLTAGKHRLKGEQALSLVRTRHGVGDGSDLGRIQLQQAFIKALTQRIDSIGLFSNPAKLYGLADTATRTVRADSGLASTGKLLGLAKDLKGIGPGNMNMVTMPVTYDPQNPNRVLPLDKASQQVWKALREDRPIPKSADKNSVGDQGNSPVTASS
ncbi:LCP family protein [Streptomyces pinistramenti]|uniref:LCP family protein n=1 Tax=Streptomyces pinistramenti TaxID=2884812 RepID=UPI001D0905C3|nr:LCP family protein [Streptomyces pinistramenti]MCB5909287.1 LCP family protein [Streptomyces pinistramenti]